MNQFLTRKIIGDNYRYRRIQDLLTEDDLKKGKKKLENSFRKQLIDWDISKNSEWVIRHYLAIKMILSSTVMLTSLKFSIERNVKVTEPYLIYYSLINTARSLLFTNPNVEWKNGDLVNSSHSKIINISGDIISQFNKETGKLISSILESAKEYRELYSYKFPTEGIIDFGISYEKAVEICGFISEISQFQSEILESLNLNSKSKLGVNLDDFILEKGFKYNGNTYSFIDSEDKYRLNYIKRKQPFPVSLHLTLSEGLVEDFFGAWHDSENSDKDEYYNPDDDWNIIFNMP